VGISLKFVDTLNFVPMPSIVLRHGQHGLISVSMTKLHLSFGYDLQPVNLLSLWAVHDLFRHIALLGRIHLDVFLLLIIF